MSRLPSLLVGAVWGLGIFAAAGSIGWYLGGLYGASQCEGYANLTGLETKYTDVGCAALVGGKWVLTREIKREVSR